MDPLRNPFTPNAGARPPALVGRDQELARFKILLSRLERGATEQSMIVTGLRGVGKTALLNACRDIALSMEWIAVEAEASKTQAFPNTVAAQLRKAILQLAPRASWSEKTRAAFATLKSFAITVAPDGRLTASIDIDAMPGSADSGRLEDDMTDLFVSVGEAAQSAGKGIVLLIDEVQFLAVEELESLIAALHKTVQRGLPVTLVAAGLPQIPKLAGQAKSYAERLFKFPSIGQLNPVDAAIALRRPIEEEGAAISDEAVAKVVELTEGYPYFLQEYGKALWDSSVGPCVEAADVDAVRPLVLANLDNNFFKVRADRCTELELAYMRAMAELGAEPQRAGDVARLLDRTTEQLGPVRARLIGKGLLFTPTFGQAAFTVPQFHDYMKRTYPLVKPTVRQRARSAAEAGD